jgi:hypothetical protein
MYRPLVLAHDTGLRTFCDPTYTRELTLILDSGLSVKACVASAFSVQMEDVFLSNTTITIVARSSVLRVS